jgi:hypothetical protein
LRPTADDDDVPRSVVGQRCAAGESIELRQLYPRYDDETQPELSLPDVSWCGCGKTTFHRSRSTIHGIEKYRCTPRFRGHAPSWKRFGTRWRALPRRQP